MRMRILGIEVIWLDFAAMACFAVTPLLFGLGWWSIPIAVATWRVFAE